MGLWKRVLSVIRMPRRPVIRCARIVKPGEATFLQPLLYDDIRVRSAGERNNPGCTF